MTLTVEGGEQPRQASPPTRRVVTILEYVVARAANPPTVADVVRATGLSRATVHAIVTELTSTGWLARDDKKGTISIGLALLSTARAVVDTDPLTPATRAAVTELVAATEMTAFVVDRVDAATVSVVEYLHPGGGRRADAEWMKPGSPITLRPPICREFIAFSDANTQAAWIGLAPAAERPRLRAALDTVRRRGFSIERLADDHRAIIESLSTLDSVPAHLMNQVRRVVSELSAVDYLDDELAAGPPVGVVTIGAPITNGTGLIQGAVVLCPNTTLQRDDVRRLGNLTAAAGRAATTTARHSTEP